MKAEDILLKKVSFYPSILSGDNTIRTLFDVLNDIRKGTYQSKVEQVRMAVAKKSCYYKIRKLKLKLPAFAPCGVFYDKRYKFEISHYTHLFMVDIDKIDKLRFNDIVEQLKSDVYISAFWTSSSGRGLQILISIEYDKTYKPEDIWVIHEYCASKQINQYFKTQYDLNLDKASIDITHVFFLSSDSNIHLKKEFSQFPIAITLSNDEMLQKRQVYNSRKKLRKTVGIYEQFNLRQEIEEE